MIAKTLKGKISQEAYIAALEAEIRALHSIAEINIKYSGLAAMTMTLNVAASLQCQVCHIARADKSKTLKGKSFIVQEVR